MLRSLFCSLNQEALWDPSLHNNLGVRISQVVPWKSQAPIMSYYPTQPFSVGVCLFCLFSLSLSLSSLWLSTPVSQLVHIQLPFLNFFLWKSKWDSLFLPIITPAKQSFFFLFFFKFIFWWYWEFGELFAKLSRSSWIFTLKNKISQFLNQKRQNSVRKPKKNQRQWRFLGLIMFLFLNFKFP